MIIKLYINSIFIKCCALILALLLVWYCIELSKSSWWKSASANPVMMITTNITNTRTSTATYATEEIPLPPEIRKTSVANNSYVGHRNTCTLVVCSIGNLGNQIWEYMSLFAVWKKIANSSYIPYIEEDMWRNLKIPFPQLSISAKSDGICDKPNQDRVIVKAEPLTTYASWFDSNKTCKNIVLEEYSSRYEEILDNIEELRKEMRYSEELVEACQKEMQRIKEKFNLENKTVTFVGMHYRGTDYLQHLEIIYDYAYPIPDSRYYVRAMEYFNKKYQNVIFLMISIDKKWLSRNKEHINRTGRVIFNPYVDDKIRDLVLLSHCNHTIINYGTFGATAALFSGGETFVYDLKLPLDHRGTTLAMGLATKLENWYAISNEEDLPVLRYQPLPYQRLNVNTKY